eukprot:5293107-Amphidinium_carterae.1
MSTRISAYHCVKFGGGVLRRAGLSWPEAHALHGKLVPLSQSSGAEPSARVAVSFCCIRERGMHLARTT